MNLKLMVLDNYAEILANQKTCDAGPRRILGDIFELRQKCFAGVRNTFLNLDSNDLCATHMVLYENSQVYAPQLIAGLRICWETRTKYHQIKLPIIERLEEINPQFKEEFAQYRKENKYLVNPNMLYVTPDLGFNKTQIPLCEMLIWAMTHWVRNEGYNGYCTVINDDFKTSRWFQNYGDWNQNLDYMHPVLLRKHKVMLVNSIYDDFLKRGELKFGNLFEERGEIKVDRKEDVPSEINTDFPLKTKVA
jgi:hypothetical protein